MELGNLGKVMIVAGLAVTAVGLILWAVSRTGLPLGQLPGDIRVERGRHSFYFPVVTCVVVSIVLTLVLTLLGRLFHR